MIMFRCFRVREPVAIQFCPPSRIETCCRALFSYCPRLSFTNSNGWVRYEKIQNLTLKAKCIDTQILVVSGLIFVETILMIILSHDLSCIQGPVASCHMVTVMCYAATTCSRGKFCEDVDGNVMSYINSTTPFGMHMNASMMFDVYTH